MPPPLYLYICLPERATPVLQINTRETPPNDAKRRQPAPGTTGSPRGPLWLFFVLFRFRFFLPFPTPIPRHVRAWSEVEVEAASVRGSPNRGAQKQDSAQPDGVSPGVSDVRSTENGAKRGCKGLAPRGCWRAGLGAGETASHIGGRLAQSVLVAKLAGN